MPWGWCNKIRKYLLINVPGQKPLGEGDLYAAQVRLCWFSLVPGEVARAVMKGCY
jgi:hypothetical protein